MRVDPRPQSGTGTVLGLGIAILAALALWLATDGKPDGLPFFPGAVYSDAVTTHLPSAQYLADSITERGEFPLWRPTVMGGQPFAANPLNKTAYPLQWLTLFIPPGPFLVLMIVLHTVIGGLGMWSWLRDHGLSQGALILGTIAYSTAPRLVAQLGMGHLDLWYAMAWLPWLMLSGRRLLSAQRVSVRRLCVVALFASLLVCADVRAALFALILFGADAARHLFAARSLRCVGRLAAAGVIVALATSAVTLPLLGWMPYLSRSQLTSAQAAELSLTPAALIGLIVPAHVGTAETLVYVGLPLLVLAAVGAVARRRWFWLAIIGFTVWYSLGPSGGLWTVMTTLIPPLQWFRVPGRAWLIIAFVVPLLAAEGFDHLLRSTRRGLARREVIGAVVFAFLCAGLGALALGSPTLPPGMGLTGIVFGPLAIVFVALRAIGRMRVALFTVGMVVLVSLDLALFARARLEWRTGEDWAEPFIPLANRMLELQPDRVFSPTYSLPQQVAEYDYFQLFGGVDPFQIAAVSAEIARAAGQPPDQTYSVVQPPLIGMEGEDVSSANREYAPDIPTLARWNVSHVVSAYALASPDLVLIDRIGGDWIYANSAYGDRDPVDSQTGWPADFAGPPSPSVVDELGTLTGAAALLSAAVYGVCALFALISGRGVRS